MTEGDAGPFGPLLPPTTSASAGRPSTAASVDPAAITSISDGLLSTVGNAEPLFTAPSIDTARSLSLPDAKRRRMSDGSGQQDKGAGPSDQGFIRAAVSEDKGARATMEDVAVVNLDARPSDMETPFRCCFAAVFDGHGGSHTAELASSLLHGKVLDAGLKQVIEQAASGAKLNAKEAKVAITQGFSSTDQAILDRCKADGWSDGACAVAAWVLSDIVIVANIGDAKAVLGRITDKDVGSVKAGSVRALLLSKDHSANLERARIEKAGGWVSPDGRLNGRMQVSRSFGDQALKQVEGKENRKKQGKRVVAVWLYLHS